MQRQWWHCCYYGYQHSPLPYVWTWIHTHIMLCTGGSLKLFSKISVVAYKSTCWSFSQQYTNVWHCTRFQFFTHFTVILYRFCGYLLSTLILRDTTMKLHHISLNFGTVGIEQFFISLPCLYIHTFRQYSSYVHRLIRSIFLIMFCWCCTAFQYYYYYYRRRHVCMLVSRGIYTYHYTFHAFSFIHLSRVQSLKFTGMYLLV